MPPKSRKVPNSEILVDESEESFSSEATASVTTDQLEKILEANHRSMMSLLASLPTPSAASAAPKHAQIKVPKWSDDETPYDYFTKFEKAMSHNGTDKRCWGQVLATCVSFW